MKARSLNPEVIQHREFTLRSVDTETRTVSGIAVPWDREIDIWGIKESFAPGSCRPRREGEPKLYYQHKEPIGQVTAYRDTDEGWEIEATISQTSLGDEAYTLLKDGVLDRFSIGFWPKEWEETRDEDGTISWRITAAEIGEVSVVANPAYVDAEITTVRHNQPKENPMANSTITAADLASVRESLDDVARRQDATDASLASLAAAPSGPRPDQFRSFGDLVKRIAAEDSDAISAYNALASYDPSQRDYTGSVVADAILKESWVGSLIEVIQRPQVVTNAFTRRKDLPKSGMSVEYALLKSNTTSVTEQTDEGTNLAFGKVALDTKTADVKTYGGYTSLSRQVIERSTIGILDTALTALAEAYAFRIEAQTRALFATTYAAATTITGDLSDETGTLSWIVDVLENFHDRNLNLDGIFMDKASFLALADIDASKKVLQVTHAPDDKIGTLTVSGTVEGVAYNFPVKLYPKATSTIVAAYDSRALVVQEDAAAPIRLQDDNIINLTGDYSVYGYAAHYAQRPAGIVKLGSA